MKFFDNDILQASPIDKRLYSDKPRQVELFGTSDRSIKPWTSVEWWMPIITKVGGCDYNALLWELFFNPPLSFSLEILFWFVCNYRNWPDEIAWWISNQDIVSARRVIYAHADISFLSGIVVICDPWRK